MSLGLHSLEGRRSPAVLRLLVGSLNQNPICLYFLFSAGSPCGCSFDDHVAYVCVRAACEIMHACFRGQHLECVPVRPSSPAGTEPGDRRGGGDNLRCSLLPACPASFCSAQLRSVKPQIIHSLGYETEEEGETEGGNERERRGAPHTLRRGQTVSFLSLYCLGSNRLPSPSQFGNRISAQCEDLHSCFISVFKFGSNICLTFPSLFQLFLLLFFFYVPGEVKWSGLLTQGDPD